MSPNKTEQLCYDFEGTDNEAFGTEEQMARLAVVPKAKSAPSIVGEPAWMSSLRLGEADQWARVRAHGDQSRQHLSDNATYVLGDTIKWLADLPANSIHAVVTDPPYGLLEYEEKDHKKLRSGRGGVWRIPPSFDGAKRQPVPRFTVLSDDELTQLHSFFSALAYGMFAGACAWRSCLHGVESAAFDDDLSCDPGGGVRETGRDNPARADAAWRRQAERRGEGICRCLGDGPVLLGAMGHVSEALSWDDCAESA